MDQRDLELLRARAQAVVNRAALLWAAQVLRGVVVARPEAEVQPLIDSIEDKLLDHLVDLQRLTFGEIDAAMSDLWAAEVQEAAERMAREFTASLANR